MPRIIALDVIRGFAILGILLLNIYGFSRPADYSHSLLWTDAGYSALDEALYGLQTLFFTGRFLTIFNLLFGASLVLIADKYGTAYLQRRLWWLAAFGLLHGALVWEGDILLWYALSALIVLQQGYLSLDSTQLWRKGMLFFAIGLLFPVATSAALYFDAEPLYLLTAEDVDAERMLWAGSYLDRILLMAESNLWMLLGFVLSMFWSTAGLMLLGAALYRQHWFATGYSVARSLLLFVAAITISGITLYFDRNTGYQYELAPFMPWELLAALLMALAYASLLIRFGITAKIGAWLAPCGRVAFTLYLTQSLVMVWLFRLAKPDWFASLDRLSTLAIALLAIAMQLLFCRIYLQYFSQGPFEWLWRRLSGKPAQSSAEQ